MDNFFEFSALGTEWSIELEKQDKILQNQILLAVDTFENNYTRFKDTSLLSELSRKSYLKNANDELIEMLKYALKTYKLSSGIFNISVGAVLSQQGYGLVDQNSKFVNNLADQIIIDGKNIQLKTKMHLDFGGFGKGWLIDKIAKLITSSSPQDFVINGGGDILVSQKTDNVELYIEDPYNSGFFLGTVSLQNGALASSSNLKRQWTYRGKTHAHIVPTQSAENDLIGSIHVLGSTALQADSLATILFLATSIKRIKLAKDFNVEFFLINKNGSTEKSPGFILNPL